MLVPDDGIEPPSELYKSPASPSMLLQLGSHGWSRTTVFALSERHLKPLDNATMEVRRGVEPRLPE